MAEDTPNTGIGAEVGGPVLPGVASREHLRLGEDARFVGFPKKGANDAFYDQALIRKEYLDSPVVEWGAYCAVRGYNPRIYSFPWKSWVREKKYRNAWETVRIDIEDEGTMLGPKMLLQQVRAVRSIPETASAMLNLLQHTLRIHIDEAKSDEAKLKAARDRGEVLPKKQQNFSLSPANAVFLASAIKQTGELLYKSLGIDSSVGQSPQKWLEIVDTAVGRIDGTQELLDESQEINPVQVQLLGGGDVQAVLASAMDQWMDRPGAPDPLEMSAPPAEGEEGLLDEVESEPEEADY